MMLTLKRQCRSSFSSSSSDYFEKMCFLTFHPVKKRTLWASRLATETERLFSQEWTWMWRSAKKRFSYFTMSGNKISTSGLNCRSLLLTHSHSVCVPGVSKQQKYQLTNLMPAMKHTADCKLQIAFPACSKFPACLSAASV